MARDFDGSTDRIDYANIWNSAATAQTIAAWIYLDATAHTTYIFVTHPNGDGALGSVLYVSTGLRIGWYMDFSTAMSIETTNNATATGSWQHILLTYDGLLEADDVGFYVNGGVISTFEFRTDGVAPPPVLTGSQSIGGRIFDDTRNLNGRIAEVGWWNRVLSAGEIAALAVGFSPLSIPDGLVFAPDLIRDQRDPVSGKAGTLDGTTVSEHPRIIRPAKLHISNILPVGAPPAPTENIVPIIDHHNRMMAMMGS